MRNVTSLVLARVAALLLSTSVAFAGEEDRLLRFSSPGPDRYADGSIVEDGECYALVWSPAGTDFSGFNADGTPVVSTDRVVLAAPLAKDGKCRDAFFHIPADEYDELKGGEWAVCLVDTRMADGVPAGVQGGKPLRVNRWGVVQRGVKFEEASNVTASSPSLMQSAATGGGRSVSAASSGVCAGVRSAVPDSVKPPRITGLDLLENGEVWLEVADTMPFLSYTIISGPEPGNLQKDSCSEVVDGKDGATISIGTAQSADCRFFRVTRAE